MVVQCQGNLLDVVHAGGPPPRLTGRIDGRQQQGDENADDGDHHQQLNERKPNSSLLVQPGVQSNASIPCPAISKELGQPLVVAAVRQSRFLILNPDD